MTLPEHFEFLCPTKTCSGLKALEHLPGELGALNARKPLLITDKSSTEKGLVERIVKALRTSGLTLGVYDGAGPDSGMDTVENLYDLYLDRGFDALLVAGSGTTVDLAKVVNIAVSGRPEDLDRCRGVDGIDNPLKPLVFIPVAAGTARECADEATLGDHYYRSPRLMPDLVIIDPRMLVDEDPLRLVAAALAALTHAAEAYTAVRGNPFVESYAGPVLEAVCGRLPGAVRRIAAGKEHKARRADRLSCAQDRLALVNAACMAGYVYANTARGLAARAGLAVSRRCAVDPALAMGALLPCVLEDHVHRRGRDLARLLKPMAGAEIFAATPGAQRFEAATGKIRGLLNELFVLTDGAVPRTLADTGLPREALAAVAEAVAAPEPDPEDHRTCLTILEHAFSGRPAAP